ESGRVAAFADAERATITPWRTKNNFRSDHEFPGFLPAYRFSSPLLHLCYLIFFACTKKTLKVKMQCDVSADTHFGPRVLPCRRDFDFTLLFEQWILALVPDLSFLILCFCRWYFIRGGAKRDTPRGGWHLQDVTVALVVRSMLLVLETSESRGTLSPQYGRISPENFTGIFSQSTYWWLNGLFMSGFRGELSLDELYPLDGKLLTKSLVSRGDQRWKEKPTRRLALFRDIIYDLRWTLAAAVGPRLCLTGFKFAQPFLINDLINYVSDNGSSEPSGVKYGFIGATVLIYVGIAVSTALFKRQAIRMVTITRGSLVTKIYVKTLHQASGQCQETRSTTLMSTDVDRIVTGLLNFHELWASPVEIVIALVLLSRSVGYPSVAALAVALVSVLGSSYLAPRMRQWQKIWVQAVQERVSFTSVVLKELRQIKMFGAESDMGLKIHRLRESELRQSKPYRSMIVGVNVLSALSTAIAPAATIAVYAATQLNLRLETPSTDVVFTSLSLISLLTSPVVLLSVSWTRFTSAIGCFDRIQEFLSKDSRANDFLGRGEWVAPQNVSGTKLNSVSAQSQPLVCMTDCSFSLGPDSPAILHGITLEIQHASYTAVTGPIGSGKSSLLEAMLGEMHLREGNLSVSPVKMAYCKQNPWIFNGTLKANIIGESHADEKWLEEVLHACNLDIEATKLPLGLDTVAGSSGAQLSGGQKQRVALARAIYARPSLLVLDDCFGPLDAVTSRMVFQQVLGRAGLARRIGMATVLVTTAVQHLKEADNLVVLSKDGRVEAKGRFEELVNKNEYMQSLSRSIRSEDIGIEEESEESVSRLEGVQEVRQEAGETAKREKVPSTPRGGGDISLYAYYIRSFGWWVFGLTLVFACLFVFCISFPQVMLSWWCGSTPPKKLHLSRFIRRDIVYRHHCDGRFYWMLIASRFSQDMSLLDMQLPVAFGISLQNVLTCIAQGALIATGSGYMSVVIPFCIVAVWTIQAFYLRTSRQVRLLDLEAKAPLYAQFLETTEGLTTIRALHWQQSFADQNAELLDTSQKPFYTMYSIQQWLQVVLDLLMAGIATVLVTLAIFVSKKTSSGALGVALVNLLSFNTTLTLLITNWTQLETSLGAIVRIKQFVTDLQLQPARNQIACPEGWPWEGRVEFRRVSASYGGYVSTPVLQNVSFSLEGGQKLGICGRTGSGKSSLLACFFSLVTITSGEILIDNVDISTLPKEKLYSALVPISQSPLVIPGSIRENLALGITSTIDDLAMVSALKEVGLWHQIRDNGGLSANIHSTKLSNGQKQILCIARAILFPGRIIIMDEPTAGFDEHTERLATELLREKLKGRTIISISHQINTVMDSDLVMVMKHGTVSELGAPQELLSRRGMFWQFAIIRDDEAGVNLDFATGGLGSSIGKKLREQGARVAILYAPFEAKRRDELLEAGYGGTDIDDIRTYECDITSADSVQSAFESLEKQIVAPASSSLADRAFPSILINTAGYVSLSDMEITPPEETMKHLTTNVLGPMLCSQAFARLYFAASKVAESSTSPPPPGRIVSISSQAAHAALHRHGAYCASKAALGGLTRSMASEWAGRGITSNTVSPTVAWTALGQKAWGETSVREAFLKSIPTGKFALPEEVADAVLFLCQDSSGMINGADIRVDGGFTVR
ncbi:ABC transporter integral membrane type 1, partial [Penicillium waksmanii]|uniref:ABC transporter integral membrane type 1 n=1 Tax=Penicillium waksmanii TaxID=69791 RepID=UPI002548E88E